MTLLFVFAGLGASLRFWALSAIPALGVPWSIVAINTIGSVLVGLLLAKGANAWGLDPVWVIALSVGFLGGMTTFSGFAIELVRYFEHQQFSTLMAYLLLQNTLAGLGCYLGYFLPHWLEV